MTDLAIPLHARAAGGESAIPPRQVAAAVMGNALEFYDFTTYAYFAVQIGHNFFPTTRRSSACCCPWRPSAPASSCGRSAPF